VKCLIVIAISLVCQICLLQVSAVTPDTIAAQVKDTLAPHAAAKGLLDTTHAYSFQSDFLADDEDILSDIYIQPEYNDPIVELGTRLQLPYYSINPFHDNRVDFSTGTQEFVSAFVFWKWFRFGYAFPLADYTRGYDFSFCPQVSNFYIELEISNIKNYKLQNRQDYADQIGQDKEDIQLDGLSTFSYHVNLEWICNKSYFSGSSAFAQSYSSGQRVSAGSMLLGIAVGRNSFRLDESSNQSAIAKEILANLPMQDNSIYNASVGCGYGYNFVVRQGKLVLGALLVPYLTGADALYQINGSDVSRFCYGMRAHGRLNLVYQWKYGFINWSSEYHDLFFYDNHFSYRCDIYSTSLSFAVKLGEFGVKSNKIPGHQFIDYINRWFE
jgi:hypothetical protein